MSKFWLLCGILTPILRIFHKGWRGGAKEDSPHLVEATKQHHWRRHFWSEGGYRGIILGDNTAGHCFVLRTIIVTRSFIVTIGYDCVTENACHKPKFC